MIAMYPFAVETVDHLTVTVVVVAVAFRPRGIAGTVPLLVGLAR